jgi:uncharacterized membrane protein YfcA
MDLTTFVLATLAVAVGATVQGTVGFGLGMLGAPLLMLIDPNLIPAPLLIAAAVLTSLLTHRDRRSVEVGHLKWSLSGRALGTIAAVLALTVATPDSFGIGFGVMILLAVAMSASGLHPPLTSRSLLIAGGVSGFMGTTISVGAPPIALVYQNVSGSKARGTMSAYFMIGVVISLIGLGTVGRFGSREIVLAAGLLPGIMVGFWLSRHTAGVLDRGYARPAVLALSAAAGVAVILRQVV